MRLALHAVWLVVSALALCAAAASEPIRLAVPHVPRQPNETSLPASTSAGWWGEVQQQIADSEYAISRQRRAACASDVEAGAVLQAPNRAHDFRLCFSERGMHAVPRSAATEAEPIPGRASWSWGLRLAGYGAPGAFHETAPLAPTSNGNRVEYAHGPLTEWYVNEARGLEQGFTLHEPLAVDAAGRTTLRVATLGTLAARATAQGISFAQADGTHVIDFTQLAAWDATGRTLAATLTPVGDALELRVDLRGAQYPVTVDPLATSAAWTAESGQANAQFGVSLATAGDVNGDGYSDVIVGASTHDNGENGEGRAFLYLGGPAGLATSPAWIAEPDQVGAGFGIAVTTAGDVNGDGYSDVAVGARGFDGGETDEGRVYVYLGGATGLGATAPWTAESDQAGSNFGYAVSSAGDVDGDGYSDLVVGAYTYDAGHSNEGRAFLYLGGPTGLAASAAWTAESDQADAFFGRAVSTAGDVNGDGYADVLVGAPAKDQGQSAEGEAYLYLGGASGLSPSAAWTAQSNQQLANLGISVSTAGDVNGDGYSDVVIGAYHFTGDQFNEGRAYVFMGSATGLPANPAWTVDSHQQDAWYGNSVSTAGDVNGDGYADVVVGAFLYDNGQTNEGRAYVYLGSASGLSISATWTAEGDQATAFFGTAVATAGDVNGDGFSDVLIGANAYDGGQTDEGRAFLYLGGADDLAATPVWSADANQPSANLGYSVSTAGDANGDGFDDVLVGAYRFDNGESDEGRVFLYFGTQWGPTSTPGWIAEPDQIAASFGYSVATAGDVNGDGYADLLIGAPAYRNGQVGEGRVFVYHGRQSGGPVPAGSSESDQQSAGYGSAVATAGDVNGDGYADAVIGCPGFDNGHFDEGRAFVLLGSASGLGSSAAWFAEPNQPLANFGTAVATAGDVNADGYSDVVIGAPGYDHGESDEGRAFVYLGGAAGLASSAAWTAEPDQASAYFGTSVATAGDVNGDGYSDVLAGAPFYDAGESNEGRAYLYTGSASGLGASAAWTAEGNQLSATFGTRVASAGDVNGDGYSDVAVGAPLFDAGETDEGRASVYLGGASGLQASASWNAEPNQADARFGYSLASAGDVNGDGYADLVVGAPFLDAGQNDEGRAFVYFGNEGRAIPLLARQLGAAGSTPVAPLNRLPSGTFTLAARGRSETGRSRVKLEWEVKPFGTPLDGSGLQRSATWTDSGLLGSNLFQLVFGMWVDDTLYHWRVRILYDPATSPLARHGRWLTLAANGLQEADLRSGDDVATDADADGIIDAIEIAGCSGEFDLDSDDDGIGDGVEDADHDGQVDAGELDPCAVDSDEDGIQDGTETGVAQPILDPDGIGALVGTNIAVFIPDADPSTTTDPLDPDTDGDSYLDGDEDVNHNGRRSGAESDPNDPESTPPPVPLPLWSLGLLGALLLGAARKARAGRTPPIAHD